MSTALTEALQLVGSELAVAELPVIATLANQLAANAKQPLELQGPADVLALAQAEEQALAAAPSAITDISATVNTLIQAKVAAWTAAAQKKIAAATQTGGAS